MEQLGKGLAVLLLAGDHRGLRPLRTMLEHSALDSPWVGFEVIDGSGGVCPIGTELVIADCTVPAVCDRLDQLRAALAEAAVVAVVDTADEDRWIALKALVDEVVPVAALNARTLDSAIAHALGPRRLQSELQRVLQLNPDGILVVDDEGTIRYANSAAAFLLERTPVSLVGAPFGFPLDEGEPTEVNVAADRFVDMRAVRITWGRETASIVSLRDVTDQRQAREHFQHLAEHDSLSGLMNRRRLDEKLREALGRAQRSGAGLAVIFVDLDNFKAINDSFGHDAGDGVLRSAAQRLRETCRQGEFLARFGGDEFVLVAESVAPNGEEQIAERLAAALAPSFYVQGSAINVSVSIGVARYPNDGANSHALLTAADAAMYEAKAAGRNAIRLAGGRSAVSRSFQAVLSLQLRRAIETEQLVMHYQPQVRTDSQKPAALEALVRWQHPEHGLLPASDFVFLAERTGLARPLGQWVLEAVCRQMADWSRRGSVLGTLPVAVNLSSHQLRDSHFAAQLIEVVGAARVQPQLLTLEVTESALLDNLSGAADTLRALIEPGMRIHIDDFGVGYSSLSYLKKLPLHALKVDRSFVDGNDADNRAIVRAIVDLAHALKLEVIAEGVEDAEQWAFVHGLGCDYCQGFYFGRPAAAWDLERLFRDEDHCHPPQPGDAGTKLAGRTSPPLEQPPGGGLPSVPDDRLPD